MTTQISPPMAVTSCDYQIQVYDLDVKSFKCITSAQHDKMVAEKNAQNDLVMQNLVTFFIAGLIVITGVCVLGGGLIFGVIRFLEWCLD